MVNPSSSAESLEKQVDHTIEEARMVLPGLQALFGFQLVAVFDDRFDRTLPLIGQKLHLCSLVLVALAIALIMAPAAYHRQVERGTVSRYFTSYASRLITAALLPLLTAISLDVALVAFVILGDLLLSIILATLIAIFFAWFWFFLPHLHRARRSGAR